MKKLGLITTAAVLLIVSGGCATGRMASTGVYYDDIYYAPDLTKETMEQAFAPVPSIAKEEQKEIKQEERQLIRSYQSSDLAKEQRDTRDFSDIQQKYASILADEDKDEVDSLIYYNEETGYWVGGFDGSEMDRDYAERLIRFHGPFTRIPYWSSLYDQFVYFDDPNWNVYVDGNYAYVFPTWSNPWYDRYRYDRWNTPWHFSFGYSSFWGDPFYYGYYGIGWYDPFYSPFYYGWPYYHRPYYSHLWYHPYHHPIYRDKHKDRYVYKGIKPTLSSNTRRVSTATTQSNTLKRSSGEAGNTITTTPSGTRIVQNADGSTNVISSNGNTQRVIQGSGQETLKSATRSSSQERTISRYQGSGASTGTVQTTSRRSSTPTYSQPDNASKPSYNRASSYTRQVRSSNVSTQYLKSGSSGSSTGRSVSTPSRTYNYNSGSSTLRRTNVQRSTYTPSRSSSSSSGYRSTSTTRSSSSYSGSSSSGSQSSGSSGSSSGSTIRSGRR